MLFNLRTQDHDYLYPWPLHTHLKPNFHRQRLRIANWVEFWTGLIEFLWFWHCLSISRVVRTDICSVHPQGTHINDNTRTTVKFSFQSWNLKLGEHDVSGGRWHWWLQKIYLPVFRWEHVIRSATLENPRVSIYTASKSGFWMSSEAWCFTLCHAVPPDVALVQLYVAKRWSQLVYTKFVPHHG